jgi:hypothetical protein
MPNADRNIKFFGVIYDEYTPAVEGQMLRDRSMSGPHSGAHVERSGP